MLLPLCPGTTSGPRSRSAESHSTSPCREDDGQTGSRGEGQNNHGHFQDEPQFDDIIVRGAALANRVQVNVELSRVLGV